MFPEHPPIVQKSLNRTFVVTGLVFCFVLAWCVLLFQGLPASDIDDWYRVLMARQVNWNTYASSFFKPWSLSLDWAGQTDALDAIHTKRILNPIVLKFSQQVFGLNSFAMYFLAKGLFFAGCVSVVFLLLVQVVPLLFAVSGMIVFLFVPAHYIHVLWIADGGTMCYFFLFLGVLIVSAVQKNILELGPRKQYACLLLTLFITGWMGIKAKESMLVLPLVVFLYSLFCFRSWKVAPLKFILLNITMLIVAFQIVPITNLNAAAVPSLNFNFETIGRLFFRNYDCGYDNETVSAFFSLEHVWPVSVARTICFFILWTTVISSVFLVWKRWILKKNAVMSFWNHSLVQICGLWLIAELPFLGMFQADPRYFSGTMAPIIILTVRLAYCATKEMGRFWSLALLLLWIFSIGSNIYENIQSTLSIRLILGQKFNYLLETAKTVLEDIKGEKVDNDLEVGEFYARIKDGSHLNPPIKNYVFYANLGIGYDGWNLMPFGQNSLEDFKLHAKKGYKYYITVEELDLSKTSDVKQVDIVDGINKDSFLEQLLYNAKKKYPKKVKIYKT